MSINFFYQRTLQILIGNGFPDENRAKLNWLMCLRWLAISVQIFSLYFAMKYEWINKSYISLYIIAVLNLAILNILTQFIIKKLSSISDGNIFFQLLCDLGTIIFLLMLTGGAWNPFVSIIFIHATIAAVLLEGKMAFLFCQIILLSVIALHSPTDKPTAIEYSPTSSRFLLPSQLIVTSLIYTLTYWLTKALSTQKKYLQKLKSEKARIDKLRALGALASGFSHEFATPLNTIKLRLERFLRKNNFSNNEDLARIVSALKQCENTLKHMNQRLLSNENTLFENKNIAELVKQICKNWNTNSRIADVKIQTQAQNTFCHIPVFAFTKTFIDILDNAEHASSNAHNIKIDTHTIIVFVDVFLKSNSIMISVSDNGGGWPDIIKKYAGEPFVTTKENGVGLGLFNAFAFASAVNGEFSLKDAKGGGACAQFSIPILEENSHFA